MPVRIKKLIGTVVLVVLVAAYAIFATAFATRYLAEAGGVVHFTYFLVSGLLWVVPAMLIIKWMETAPRR